MKVKLLKVGNEPYVNVNDLIQWFERIRSTETNDAEVKSSCNASIKLLLHMLDESDKQEVKKVYFSNDLSELVQF